MTSNSGKTCPSAVRKKYSFVGFRFHECISSWNQLQIPVKSSPWLFFAGYVYINTHTLYTTTTTTLPSRKLYNKGSAVDFTTCHYHTGGCARTPLRQAGGIRWNQAGLHGYRPNFQTPPFPHPHILPPSGASFLCIMCGIEVTGEFKVSQRPLQSNYSLYVSHWAEGVFTLSDWHNSKIEHLAVLGAIGKNPLRTPLEGPRPQTPTADYTGSGVFRKSCTVNVPVSNPSTTTTQSTSIHLSGKCADVFMAAVVKLLLILH